MKTILVDAAKTDPHINNKGLLDVGDGHQIYWEDWGNPKGKPIFHLHGGPGGGFNDRHKVLYDPKKHRVIFHDQRGSGKSTPYAEIKNNTTDHLIADIEKLRTHLGIEKIYVTGGSWGSTLALFYSMAHPEHVIRMVVWSVFLSRQFEYDFINEGYPKYFFPEAWERFISRVPESNRKNGDEILKYYAEKINSSDAAVAKSYADEWALWESTLVSLNYNRFTLEMNADKENNMAISRIETHYFLNKCFVPKNYIFDNLSRIKHIPLTIVQGRFDMCTPPISAYELSQAYGDNLTLNWVNAGHLRTEPEMLVALKATVSAVLIN